MSDLQRGRLFFSIGGIIFFSGAITLGILITYGTTGAWYRNTNEEIIRVNQTYEYPAKMVD